MAAESPALVPLGESSASHGILLRYRDGMRATILKIGISSTRWNFACRLGGDPQLRATRFYTGPWGNRNLFQALSHAIQDHFRAGRSPYPVERTLLTTGICEAAMRSRDLGRSIATPHLHIAYEPRDFRACREMGATWRLVTSATPEPRGLNTGVAVP
jgi:hypothetical protein